jgi:hypothetical protein
MRKRKTILIAPAELVHVHVSFVNIWQTLPAAT